MSKNEIQHVNAVLEIVSNLDDQEDAQQYARLYLKALRKLTSARARARIYRECKSIDVRL